LVDAVDGLEEGINKGNKGVPFNVGNKTNPDIST
jgi:hypothetical protein